MIKLSKKLSLLLAMVLVLSMVLVGCGGSKDPKDTSGDVEGGDSSLDALSFTFANYLPSGNPFEEYVFNPLAEQLKEKANIELEYFPGGTLVGGGDILDGVISGVADMGLLAIAYVPGRLPISFLIEYPAVAYTSAKSASYTLKDFITELQPEELKDIKVLFPYCSGPGCFLTNKAIKTADDVKGMQIRSNAIQAEIVTALGGTPSTLTMDETYEALRSGIVDGFIGLQEAGYTFKLEEVTDYMTYMPYTNIAFYVIMNQDKYDAMSDEQKAIFDEVCENVFETSASSFQGQTGKITVKAMEDAGNEVITLPQGEIDKIGEKVAPIAEEYAKSLDEQGYEGSKALELLRELAEKNNELYPSND
jgi:TRAP-type C4-dicarboxylate transport system substrate-binding protein